MAVADTKQPDLGASWRQGLAPYGAQFVVVALALLAWSLWPVMHEDVFAVFIAGVIVSARFFGFGPALFCTFLSVLALDYFVFAARSNPLLSRNDGQRLLLFVMVSVLTAGLARQRSRAETRAGEVRQRMAAIVECSDDAILSTATNGAITSWNRGAETLYGYSAAEALGRHISFLYAPGHEYEFSRHEFKLKRGEHIAGHQTEHVRKNGSLVPVMLSISPLRNHLGAVVGSSAIASDMTAEKRAEQVLRRNEKLATAGRLAATVAHEINNPLEAVTNLLYLARHDPQGRENYLRLAEKEVERIAAIAQQTLGFVRESSSPMLLNVAETMEQVLHLYSRKLEVKHIQIDKQYDTGVNIQGFVGELRQLFSNLVLNAADAMEEGGKLRLRVSPAREWSNRQRTGVRVTVADTGAGIPSADRVHLFEPFYTTKKDFGTGLGLWVSQGIVKKHHGWIRIRSRTTPGASGTVFSIFLPGTVEVSQGPVSVGAEPLPSAKSA